MLKLSFTSLLSVIGLMVLSLSAQAALMVTAPSQIAQGTALMVSAKVEQNTPIIFSLQKYKITVEPVFTGTHWQALALLPVGVDDLGPLKLKVQAAQASKELTIPIITVAWPRQEITVDNKYVAPPKSVADRIKRESARSRAAMNTVSNIRYWEPNFVRPVPGAITSGFGGKRVFNGETRSYHKGVDLRAATGTPIKALGAGKVLLADDLYFSGKVVYLDHGLGVISVYAHMSELKTQAGNMVQAGQVIGLVGATGRVTGPHLHLSLGILGYSVNPMSLNFMQN